MTTITNSKIELKGMDIKKIKAMVKGHRHNKKFDGLNYVLFETSNDSITVTYNNSNDLITINLEAYEADNASFLFPVDAIKKMSTTKTASHVFVVSPDSITVEHIEDGIFQSYNAPETQAFYNNSYNGMEFNNTSLTIYYNTLRKLFKANISASNSESRPVLQNVVLRQNKIIATDGCRLFMNNDNDFNLDEDIKIPTHIVSLIESLTEKGDSLTIATYDDFLKLYNRHVTIYARGTGGNFPEVDRLVPDYFNTTIEIKDHNKFKKTLEAIKKGDKRNNLTQVEFDYNNSTMRVYNNLLNISADIKIKVQSHDDMKEIAFSAAYLLDAMKQLNNDDITIKFVGGLRPFIVQSLNDNDSLVLASPVKVK